jgi:hypothetical protein
MEIVVLMEFGAGLSSSFFVLASATLHKEICLLKSLPYLIPNQDIRKKQREMILGAISIGMPQVQ